MTPSQPSQHENQDQADNASQNHSEQPSFESGQSAVASACESIGAAPSAPEQAQPHIFPTEARGWGKDAGLQWFANTPWSIGKKSTRRGDFLHLIPAAVPPGATLAEFEFKLKEEEDGGYLSKVFISAPDLHTAAQAGAEFCWRGNSAEQVQVFIRPPGAQPWQVVRVRLPGPDSDSHSDGPPASKGDELRARLKAKKKQVRERIEEERQEQIRAVATMIDQSVAGSGMVSEFLAAEASALIEEAIEALNSARDQGWPASSGASTERALANLEQSAGILARARVLEARENQVFEGIELGLLRLHRFLAEAAGVF